MHLQIQTFMCFWLTVSAQEDPTVWNNIADAEINHILNVKDNTGLAKNVILFLGDGMGINTVTASRLLKTQLLKKPSNEPDAMLELDKFDNAALLKTYNLDYSVPDSAGTATAYLCGVKTNLGMVGVDGRARRANCSTQAGHNARSILHWSRDAGKSVGVVTTTRITHASPAAAYAHSVERYWEGDSDMMNISGAESCTDIAKQLVMNNSDIQVLFGGGRRYFLSINDTDQKERNATLKEIFQRRDMNLIEYWKNDKKARNLKYRYVSDRAEFQSINTAETDYVLGLFNHNSMDYEIDRNPGPNYGEPSLAEMTEKAIEILKKNENGFFLFVEGARIDHAHHDNFAKRALFDTLAMEDAIKIAKGITDKSDTLLIATADHSHPLSLVGYAPRGYNIFDKVPPYSASYIPRDGIPYTPLLYGTGPGNLAPRENRTNEQTNANDYRPESTVFLKSGTHSGEDVGVYAQGPWAHLFRSVHEQNYVAHVMAYASCVGPYKDKCHEMSSSTSWNQFNFLTILVSIAIYLINC